MLHNLYSMVVDMGLAEDLSNDLEGVAVPGHRFLRKGAKFISLRMEYTLG